MSELVKSSNIIEYENPKYIFLRIKPSKSIRNYNSESFIPIVASLYNEMSNKIKVINNKLHIKNDIKLGYYIYMEKLDKKKVYFYFIVPEKHYLLFHEKIIEVWSNKVSVIKEDNIPCFDIDCTKYYMTYKKADALSLVCDKRNNTLLGNQLNVLRVMHHGDKIGVFYNFMPMQQKYWKSSWDNTVKDMQQGIPVYHNKIRYLIMYLVNIAINIIDTIISAISFSDGKSEPKKIPMKDINDLGKSSKEKRDKDIVKAQIICFSESKDKDRENQNALALCNSFECLNEDNELIHKKLVSNKINLLDTKIKDVDVIRIQPKEAQNMICLPGDMLLNEFKEIDHIKILQTEVPDALQSGYISLGINEYKETKTEAFLFDKNYDQANFPLVPIGEQGSGKTTYMANYVNYAQKKDEACIIIDFIKQCELSETIKKVVPREKIVELELSDLNNIQGIGYNELKPKSKKPYDILKVANQKALYIQMLIDALNADGNPLTSSMDKYLNAASNIVFLKNDASLRDVMKCLEDYQYRDKCIADIPTGVVNLLEDEIRALRELDEYNNDKTVVKGTRDNKIDGISHRINILKKDLSLKVMFNKGCENNVDLVKAIDDGKVILFKMPQVDFPNPQSKNVIVTYLFTKIWCSALVRGAMYSQPKRFHVIVDEINLTKTAMQMLHDQDILTQTRKYGCKFVLSCQNIGQLSLIHQTLLSAGASYLFMKGSGKSNFNEFKEELDPYTLEDIQQLPQYHSLNLINYNDVKAKFITKLPKPL